MLNSPLLLFRSVLDPDPAGSALFWWIRFQTWISIWGLLIRILIRIHFDQV
jgi:hypothetical protein